MISANGKILVSVDYDQKLKTNIGGMDILLAKKYSDNRRESNPVMCTVVNGSEKIQAGKRLLVHHNRFVENSPHHLGDNLYSLALNNAIFGWVDELGSVHPLFENILVERIYDKQSPFLPEHLWETSKTKFKVTKSNYGFKEGQIVFCYPYSDYEIVYNYGGKELRVVKVKKEDIVGKLVN